MLYRIVRSVNLALAGMLAGNEFGTWAAVHRSLEQLSPPERIRSEQDLTRRFGAIMPVWMVSTVFSCFVALLFARDGVLRGYARLDQDRERPDQRARAGDRP